MQVRCTVLKTLFLFLFSRKNLYFIQKISNLNESEWEFHVKMISFNWKLKDITYVFIFTYCAKNFLYAWIWLDTSSIWAWVISPSFSGFHRYDLVPIKKTDAFGQNFLTSMNLGHRMQIKLELHSLLRKTMDEVCYIVPKYPTDE